MELEAAAATMPRRKRIWVSHLDQNKIKNRENVNLIWQQIPMLCKVWEMILKAEQSSSEPSFLQTLILYASNEFIIILYRSVKDGNSHSNCSDRITRRINPTATADHKRQLQHVDHIYKTTNKHSNQLSHIHQKLHKHLFTSSSLFHSPLPLPRSSSTFASTLLFQAFIKQLTYITPIGWNLHMTADWHSTNRPRAIA